MRISDWSSDVCSSDLGGPGLGRDPAFAGIVEQDGDPDEGAAADPFDLAGRRRRRSQAVQWPFSDAGSREDDRGAGLLSVAQGPRRCGPVRRRCVRRHLHPGTLLSDQHRSEEHTSELQSLMRTSYADFSLKKKTIRPQSSTNQTNTTLNYITSCSNITLT